MLGLTEKALGIKKGLAFVSSTGVIVQPLPMDKAKKDIPHLTSDKSFDTRHKLVGK